MCDRCESRNEGASYDGRNVQRETNNKQVYYFIVYFLSRRYLYGELSEMQTFHGISIY